MLATFIGISEQLGDYTFIHFHGIVVIKKYIYKKKTNYINAYQNLKS